MTEGKVYFAQDCDRDRLKGKRIAVIGFGSQGRAFALNLRDSECNISVVLREASTSREAAESEQLEVLTPAEITDFDIFILAIPDHEQMSFYRQYLQELDPEGRTIVLLHGLNFHFENIKFSEAEDIILLAPHGPGDDLRKLYNAGSGLSCFLAIGQDSSGGARELGLALADAAGCSRAGIYKTTFANETIGDLFGEQALLVGGLAGLTDAVMETMLEAGLPPRNVQLETAKQLKLLASLIEEHGPAGMIERVSRTAGFGALRAIPRLFTASFKAKLQELYQEIDSGEFNRALLADAASDFRKYNQMIEEFRGRVSKRTVEENSENN